MSLVGFKAKNHPQQIALRGADDQVDDRDTPDELFDVLAARFGPFDLDVAAAPHNARCERFYTIQDNGLALPWNADRVWCNPPYSDLAAWVTKAWSEWLDKTARDIVMLVPANRCEQRWWQDHVEPWRDTTRAFRTEFLRGRTRFILAGKTEIEPNQRPPFSCALLTWRRHTPEVPPMGEESSHV